MCYLSALLTDVTLLYIPFVFSLDGGRNTRQIQTSATSRQASEEGLKKHLEIVVISSSGRWDRLVILSGPLAKLGLVKEIDGEI